MASNQTPSAESSMIRFRWLALFVLTGINLLNYIDRYIFSALLPAIKKDLGFTDTELGILGSAFLFAYTFASPVFGLLGDKGRRSRLMSYGVGIWSVATAFSGLTTTFLGQFVTRAFVGLGESAYSVIAPSSIADYFSKASRGKVFAVYSGAIPVGSALGYVMGGWLEPHFGWQKSFFVVGVPGLLLALILFFLPDPKRGSAEELDGNFDQSAHEKDGERSLVGVYRALLENGGFLTTVLGYAAYTFVVGGLAFWMPSYLVRYFDVSLEKANVQFGTLTVAGGFVGTLIGGAWSDWEEKTSGNGFLKISFYSMILSAPLFWYALSIRDYSQFMVALFLLEVALFLCISPLDAAVVSYVRPAWRSTSMALNVFLIHVLGDGVSRTLMGIVSDRSELRDAIGILPWALLVAGVFWAVGFILYWQPLAWPKGALKLPRLQAHRGYLMKNGGRDEAVVENTLEAFRRARAAGWSMSECDVQLTKDGEAVVFHDEDLKRLFGLDLRVRDLTADEMKSRAGAPRLIDLLRDQQSPNLINIEIKSRDVFAKGLEAACARAVKEAAAEGRVIFSSFNPYALHRVAKLAPRVPRALLATEESYSGNGFYLRRMLLGFWAQPHMVNLAHEMLTADRMEKFTDRGLRVAAWTVNDPTRADELLKMGVASVISDEIFDDRSGAKRKS